MKLTIASNGTIRKVDIIPNKTFDENDNLIETDGIHNLTIDFDPPTLWSDFELWLEDDDGNLVDYKKINLSKTNKMKMSGGL